jgi:cell volume regulation protein A
VFIAGIALGDLDAPYQSQIRLFQVSLASLAEIVVFVALGLTVDLRELIDDRVWLDGLLLAIILAFVARPLALAPLLLPLRLRMGERIFVAWSGLKGAVPILLASFAILADVEDSRRLYEIVFVVVAFSVVVQGSSIPFAARRLGVRMRRA